ncbi:hypothetical protein PG991_012946 [Apiospora marii]|uniref:Uncharacterized protein n=1 Tax=Apiospora marii TaxID=335849 RepID=A0ABR1RB45_9PEZI
MADQHQGPQEIGNTSLTTALNLATEKAAALLAAKPVEMALWSYDERFLQPRLEQLARADAAEAQRIKGVRRPRHQPSDHKSLTQHPASTVLWEDHFRGVEARLRTEAYRGACQDVHASLAAWRILRWLQTPEAAALGLGHLFFVEEKGGPGQWGQSERVPGIMLEYLYDFEDETSV